MTIEELLRRLQEEHGNDWARKALNRLLDLDSSRPVERVGEQEVGLLYTWALEMIEAGVAFKQSQSREE